MTQQEYDQKKRKCWEEYCQQYGHTYGRIAFDFAFDRAYALGKQEKDGIDLKKLNEMLDDTLKKETKESLNQWLSEKNADTVIQGWVARNEDGELYIYSKKPNRTQWLRWAEGSNFLPLLPDLFPDLTWEDDPQEVEIIIKRKKNGY